MLSQTADFFARTSHCSVDVLEHILCHDECDVDPVNKLEKDTPLHLAVRTKDPKMRVHLVESLLEAGADLKYVHLSPFLAHNHDFDSLFGRRVKNKYGETARDLIKADDNLTLAVFTTHQAGNDIGADDIACTFCRFYLQGPSLFDYSRRRPQCGWRLRCGRRRGLMCVKPDF